MEFETIDLTKHRDMVIRFRKDSFQVSFGTTSDFGKEDVYLNWLETKIKAFPKGFVMVKEDEKYIGQVELSIREYKGKDIGYVHLFYLIPEKRGAGKGKALHQYAMQFFKNYDVKEYHLRVSPFNTHAYMFYRKIGMVDIGPELNGKVIRMKGRI